ncbi:hypothetical protein O4090_17785, partial [Dietzia kunjamensis]|nr:hypothetical protein [Dietzia kunjamensis]
MSTRRPVVGPGHLLLRGAALVGGALPLVGCMTTTAIPQVDPTDAGTVRLDEVTVQRFEYP